MGAVVALGVYPIEMAHALRQIRFRRFDQDVVVVRHLAPGMAHPVKAFADRPEYLQPCFPVRVRQIYILLSIAPRCDVVYTAG